VGLGSGRREASEATAAEDEGFDEECEDDGEEFVDNDGERCPVV